jgi:glycosyltransferase involved in cell wall biosynthesis
MPECKSAPTISLRPNGLDCSYATYMNILLAMALPYEPAWGGANKANRMIAEILAHRGHSVSAIASKMLPLDEDRRRPTHVRDTYSKSGSATGVIHFVLNAVQVTEVDTSVTSIRSVMKETLASSLPDCILVSSEDPLHLLLRDAVGQAARRVVYLAHTPNCLPFGPYSFYPDHRATSLLHRVAAIVAVSRFCADYIRDWSSLVPVHIYLPVYGTDIPASSETSREGFVTLINPCAYKGIDIFIALAESCPGLKFAAIPSWGTTSNDIERLRARRNITLLPASSEIDDFLQQTGIVVVPSLYLENFPMIIIESMIRGIPVVASSLGGIPEAKLGTGYLIPVVQIETFLDRWDERKLWVPIVPEQDVTPWRNALIDLQSSEASYCSESTHCRAAATTFTSSLSIDPFEALLLNVVERNQGTS